MRQPMCTRPRRAGRGCQNEYVITCRAPRIMMGNSKWITNYYSKKRRGNCVRCRRLRAPCPPRPWRAGADHA